MKISHSISIIFFTAILIISGCGGSGSGTSTDSSMAITGSLSGDGFVQHNWFDKLYSRIVNIAYAAGNRPDKIVVVAKDGRILNNFEIADDGTFEIEIEELDEENFTLFVQNTVNSEVSGHIKLSNGANPELDIFDGSTFKNGLQLGTMDVDDLTGPSIDDTDAFEDAGKVFLKELANNDDAIASHQNKLTNSSIDSNLAIVFNLGNVASVTDSFFDISTFSKETNFKGMMPLFYYYGDEAPDLENVTLYPPANILHSDPNNTQNDLVCDIPANTNIGIDKAVSYNDTFNIVTIETAYVDRLPEGEWTLINADTGSALGAFVFADAKPFNSNTVFKSFVPIPKINTVENTVISVNLKFNRYDNSGTKPINKHFFDTLSEDLNISYVLTGSNTTHNLTVLEIDDDSFEIIFEPTELIIVGALDRLIISYKIGEAKYQFFVE